MKTFSSTTEIFHCPLCLSNGPFENWAHRAWNDRRFLNCPECDAIFVPAADQVPLHQERDRYAAHHNDLNARGFRDFLMKTVDTIRERSPAGARILDFGSGPEPSLSKLLIQEGFEVVSFDPHFNPVEVSGTFDLILAHEVFEHLRDVSVELAKIRERLRPGGVFLIRSEPRPPRESFADWWYARDFTHVFFASERTLDWIAKAEGWNFEEWSPQLWAFRSAQA